MLTSSNSSLPSPVNNSSRAFALTISPNQLPSRPPMISTSLTLMVNLQPLILRDHQHCNDHLLLPDTLSSFGSTDTTLHILLVSLLPQWTILTCYISVLPWPLNVRRPNTQSPSLPLCPASEISSSLMALNSIYIPMVPTGVNTSLVQTSLLNSRLTNSTLY